MGKDTGIGVLCIGLYEIPRDIPVISFWDFMMGIDSGIGVLCKGLCGLPRDIPGPSFWDNLRHIGIIDDRICLDGMMGLDVRNKDIL